MGALLSSTLEYAIQHARESDVDELTSMVMKLTEPAGAKQADNFWFVLESSILEALIRREINFPKPSFSNLYETTKNYESLTLDDFLPSLLVWRESTIEAREVALQSVLMRLSLLRA